MCSRGGVGVARGSSGMQPMKATVPFQLNNNSISKPQSALRDAKPVSEKQLWCSLTGQNPHSHSLDAIVGPYLHGHWPREGSHYKKDKSTQTPASWADNQQSSPGGGSHKRSASWGSAAHKEGFRQRQQQQCAVVLGGSLDRRRIHAVTQAGSGSPPWITQSQPLPIPLNGVHTRLRHSEEKLDQELETIFKQHSLLQDFLVPNGRRGPVPPYCNCCGEHQTCLSSSPSPSPSSSPATSILSSSSSSSPDLSLPSSPVTCTLDPVREVCGEDGLSALPLLGSLSLDDRDTSAPPGVTLSGNDQDDSAPSLGLVVGVDGDSSAPCLGPVCAEDGPVAIFSSSPRPNKSVCFQREPPEGCEKVPVCEEVMFSVKSQSRALPCCPDPDKVNFTPRRGSTFCPVSLHKPLPSSMDFLFHSLSVSPISERAGRTGTGRPTPDSAATTKRERCQEQDCDG
ncbi:protein FAM117A-like [Alosa sapidissima]|uniref:protein FAM117A-like n=1 Tax=Alosa sapidissima TaxID=34773 RepID=UPI001C0874E3|nr:protein FAM117A-like [Alosa sapidissima]